MKKKEEICQRHSWLLQAKVVAPPMQPINLPNRLTGRRTRRRRRRTRNRYKSKKAPPYGRGLIICDLGYYWLYCTSVWKWQILRHNFAWPSSSSHTPLKKRVPFVAIVPQGYCFDTLCSGIFILYFSVWRKMLSHAKQSIKYHHMQWEIKS